MRKIYGRRFAFQVLPEKRIDKDIMPYLDVDIDDNWLDGNHQAPHFYDVVRQYSTWEEDNGCWPIEDPAKLFEMAGKQEIPEDMTDYN